MLEDRHDLLVRSVVVLLSRRANLAAINGIYSRQFEGESPHVVFRYRVIRVWEIPVRSLLEGGLGTLPLAPISDVRQEDLPPVIERMKDRLRPKVALGKELWAATYVLLGLYYETPFIDHLLRGVITMEESTTYQAIIEEGLHKGAIQEAKKVLVVIGTKRFGAPSRSAQAAINAEARLERVERLIEQSLDVSSWEDLLGLPPTRRRR